MQFTSTCDRKCSFNNQIRWLPNDLCLGLTLALHTQNGNTHEHHSTGVVLICDMRMLKSQEPQKKKLKRVVLSIKAKIEICTKVSDGWSYSRIDSLSSVSRDTLNPPLERNSGMKHSFNRREIDRLSLHVCGILCVKIRSCIVVTLSRDFMWGSTP